MRIVKSCYFQCRVAGVTPATGAAQDRPLHFNIGGGPTFIMGDLADRFEMGWGPALGITFDVNERVGFQFEYAYRWFGIPDEVDIVAGSVSRREPPDPRALVQHHLPT